MVELGNLDLQNDLKSMLTADQVRHYGIVITARDDDQLTAYHKVAADQIKLDELSLVFDLPVRLKKIDEDHFDQIVATNYRISAQKSASQSLKVSEDSFDAILNHAHQVGASDIHIEPLSKKTRVRFRLDGALKTFYEIPLSEHSLLVNKIKIRSNLNISEKRRNQDGRISLHLMGAGRVDVRVSSLPSLHGEKMVLRLLESNQEDISIDKIGFSAEQKKIYQKAYRRQNGIILISGPTGSGKTTTLYATLKELNAEEKNVLTVEDPIEYTLDGINQVQVKHDIGFDFTAALKTFLRQDPDIIMVGEIRDKETAQMAVKASLTGHLVLSTIHTNSALGTIDRLKDMDIPEYLIASTLNLSVAQRLVRLLCPHCKKAEESKVDLMDKKASQIHSHYIASGCNKCQFTGYAGRTALFEMIENNRQMSSAIKHNTYISHAESIDIPTIKNQAVQLLRDGKTSYEEIYPLLIE
jgi:type IV pilus assembly protein PilB